MRALPGCFEGPMAFGNITMTNDNVVGSTPELHNRGPPDPCIACTPHYFDIQAQPPLLVPHTKVSQIQRNHFAEFYIL
jgi:hypothetical protein